MNDLRLDVRSDIDRVVAEFSAAASGALPKAIYRAINRAVDKMATETSREVRKVYNLKDRAVKAAMKKRYANAATLLGTLRLEGARVPLIEFDARWSRRMPGASVRIKVAGGRKTFAGSFIARDPRSGQPTVYVRKGKERVPLKNLRSISIPQAVSTQAVRDAVQVLAAQSFETDLRQQLTFLLGYR